MALLSSQRHLHSYIQQRVKLLSNGKIAADAISSVPYILGTVPEPERTLATMCPPAAERIAAVNAWRATTAGGNQPPTPAITTMPPGASDSVIINRLATNDEGGKLLGSLHHVFGHAEPSNQLFRDARGDPYRLITALVARAASASTPDVSVVVAEFEAVKTGGISGELTLDKIKGFQTKYERAKISLDPASRPTDAAELELVNLIAFRDVLVREAYGLRTTTAPNTFSDAIEILKAILTSQLRAEQLDAAMSGQATQMGLMAKQPDTRIVHDS